MKIAKLLFIISLSTLMVACGSSPVRNEPVVKKAPSTGTTISKKPGGYYLDDGPADNAPKDIDGIPDAVPRMETPLARANKPYTALGARFTPMTSYVPFKQTGTASWYGKRYHGQKTSSGEVYDMFAMSAAHPTLPLPSYVKVTNPANGRSVIVRINDRGPFHSDRIIDLSYAAAYKLRLTNTGSGNVEIEAIDAATFKPSNRFTTNQEFSPSVANNPSRSKPTVTTAVAMTTTIAATNNNAATTQYYVQIGAFKSDVNAQKLENRIESLDLATNIGIASALYKDGLYRVKLGPYVSRQDADSAANNIRQKLAITALVVNQ